MALSTITDSFDHRVNSGHGINVGHNERLASLVGGGLLAVLGLRRADVAGAALALAGGALVARGLTGYCPVKNLLADWEHAKARAIPAQDIDEGRNQFSRHPGDIYETDDDKETLDEALEQSFPASDPPPINPGVAR
ncbi:YgaP-like transmembrane domain [Azospirillum doebereinerae]|uniref:DUF2892 domain-containing protein n=1 Tax=Azospirillum doebereinerae TaxID=92933 RepID=A0A433JEU6_9PROT|nr:YgaP-like transmembrane domain [Azospirillum doebereinerae]MCG5239115.1 DUF2892 domain-containing protein [Azospirillum doebereinerae]RUQ75689.1 DUF2892 domain-containing protein [Azospirillum doebereinerae]